MKQKWKGKYDPKIETVKYLAIFTKSTKIKVDWFLTLPQKCANFLALYLVIQFLMQFFSNFR